MFGRSMEAPVLQAEAHCDGPCGVYDPASARIAAEAVQSMTKKMLGLTCPDPADGPAMAAYLNTMSRYAAIKEEEAHKCKEELLVLWTDFFKPQHLKPTPTFTTPSGTLPNSARPVRLRSRPITHKNSWMPARPSTTCSGP